MDWNPAPRLTLGLESGGAAVSRWEYVEGACECCGKGAWIMPGLAYPMGDHFARVRCDWCRRECSQQRGPCKEVQA